VDSKLGGNIVIVTYVTKHCDERHIPISVLEGVMLRNSNASQALQPGFIADDQRRALDLQ
jgi:hypothetical protein